MTGVFVAAILSARLTLRDPAALWTVVGVLVVLLLAVVLLTGDSPGGPRRARRG